MFAGCQLSRLKRAKLSLSMLGALLLAVAIFVNQPATAQESPEEKVLPASEVTTQGVEDILGRGTPRGSAMGFLEACSEFDFGKASKYLDLRNLRSDVRHLGGEDIAKQLCHVLARTVWLDELSVSDSPEGAKGDDLPDYRDLMVSIEVLDEKHAILLQRIPREDGEFIWKVSNRSLSQVPALYKKLSYSPPVEVVRNWFPQDSSWLGVEWFKWLIILVVVAFSWPFFWFLGRFLTWVFSLREGEASPLTRKLFTGPFVLVTTMIAASISLNQLGVGRSAQRWLDSKTLIIFAIVWGSWVVINLYKGHKQARLIALDRQGEARLIQPITTLVKLSVLVVGLLIWMHNIGVNITAVLAGFGIGGLAVALALQKPIEDMMAAFSMFSQGVIHVGDFCGTGQVKGVIEDIGLRSTRFRTYGNTIVSIPNSRLAYAEIENFTAREKIRYFPIIRVGYDTTQEQLQRLTTGISEMLEQDDRVDENGVFTHFTDFADDAMLVKISAFVKTTDWFEYLRISEELNLKVMGVLNSVGVSFALPGKAVFMEGLSKPETVGAFDQPEGG